MSLQDYLVRNVTRTAGVRGLACVTTNLVNEACRRHGTFPTASVALGRALTGGVLMGALLKSRQRVALKFEGNGPLQKIVVEAESNGTVSGYVADPEVELPRKEGKFDVAGALGEAGLLTVTKDLRMVEPYTGVVQLYTSEIAEDLAYYLAESEQVPSAVGLGVFLAPDGSVAAAGGFLIQSLISTDEPVVERLTEQIGKMPSITELLHSGKTPEDLLEMIFAGIPVDTLEKRGVTFQCSCSKKRVEKALLSLGPEEINSIIQEQGKAEVTCEFCRETYSLSREELERLMAPIH